MPVSHILWLAYMSSRITPTLLRTHKIYLIMALIFISLMTNGVERIFTCLLAIYVSSLVECQFKSFAHKIEFLHSFWCKVRRITGWWVIAGRLLGLCGLYVPLLSDRADAGLWVHGSCGSADSLVLSQGSPKPFFCNLVLGSPSKFPTSLA